MRAIQKDKGHCSKIIVSASLSYYYRLRYGQSDFQVESYKTCGVEMHTLVWGHLLTRNVEALIEFQ